MKRGDSKTWGVLLVAGAALAVGIVFSINVFVEKPARVVGRPRPRPRRTVEGAANVRCSAARCGARETEAVGRQCARRIKSWGPDDLARSADRICAGCARRDSGGGRDHLFCDAKEHGLHDLLGQHAASARRMRQAVLFVGDGERAPTRCGLGRRRARSPLSNRPAIKIRTTALPRADIRARPRPVHRRRSCASRAI